MRRVLTHQAVEVNPDVRLELVERICSPAFGTGWGRGSSYGEEKSKLLVGAGFQPARDLFWASTRSCVMKK